MFVLIALVWSLLLVLYLSPGVIAHPLASSLITAASLLIYLLDQLMPGSVKSLLRAIDQVARGLAGRVMAALRIAKHVPPKLLALFGAAVRPFGTSIPAGHSFRRFLAHSLAVPFFWVRRAAPYPSVTIAVSLLTWEIQQLLNTYSSLFDHLVATRALSLATDEATRVVMTTTAGYFIFLGFPPVLMLVGYSSGRNGIAMSFLRATWSVLIGFYLALALESARSRELLTSTPNSVRSLGISVLLATVIWVTNRLARARRPGRA